jgi:hypothetical protein
VSWTALAVVVTAIVGGLTTLPFIGPLGTMYAIVVAIAVNVVIGLPVTLFVFNSRTSWPEVAATGFAVGAVPFVVVHLLVTSTSWDTFADTHASAQFTAAGAVCGTATALCLWWLRGRQLHDKT